MSVSRQEFSGAALAEGAAWLLVGGALWALVAVISRLSLAGSIVWLYRQVGITFIALAPLAIWGIWCALRGGSDSDLTLAYIGATAQRFGLLGTVIGIVAATVKIGSGLEAGAATAVTGALPAVGQALVSTAVGFIVAIICDFARFLNERQEAEC